jgi:iron complex outermembrane recepter protein
MRYIFSAFLLLNAIVALAQEQVVKGFVKDNTAQPVAAATVSLLQAADSSWVQSEFTDDNGNFIFEKIQEGKYLVDVQEIGYVPSKMSVEVNGSIAPLEIVIDKNTNSLQQVTITANKPFIENSAGKITVNVSSSIAGSGSNVLDLLRKSPGVVIDGEGNISIAGKQGITVLINERPTYLSGRELSDYLRSLPSEDVEKLELITQPSARYDAEGSGGIINIVQKKNRKEGFNGKVTLTPGMGIYPTTHNNVNLAWKKNRLNMYANANYMRATGFMRGVYTKYLLDENSNIASRIEGEGFWKEIFSNDLLRVGVDYDMTDKTTAGMMVSGNYHPNTEVDLTTDAVDDIANNSHFYSKAYHEQGFLRKRVIANAYVKHQLNENSSIVTNADYTHSFSKSREYLRNTLEDKAGNELPGNLLVRSWVPAYIDAYSLKSDYNTDLNKKTKIEAGIKCSYTKTDNNAMFDVYSNNSGEWTNDTSRSNHFIYKENINAAYVSMNKELSDKWKIQAGLRAENANISGNQEVKNQYFERHTLSIFPTAYASYAVNKKNEFQLNYGRRIERPAYNNLNPFALYESQFSYSVGNPMLRPQMAHNVELTHVYNSMLTSRLSYSNTKNMINGVAYTDKEQANVTYRKPENIAKENTTAMSVTMYKKLLAWWELSVMGYGYYSEYYDGLADARRYGTGYGVNVDSQFNFKGGWRAESHISFLGRRQEGIYAVAEPAVYNSCGVSKKIFKDSGSVSLNIEDPFFTYRYNWTAGSELLQATGRIQHNTMHYGLSFIYNFGRENGAKQRDNNNDEVRRM